MPQRILVLIHGQEILIALVAAACQWVVMLGAGTKFLADAALNQATHIELMLVVSMLGLAIASTVTVLIYAFRQKARIRMNLELLRDIAEETGNTELHKRIQEKMDALDEELP
jgi:hypothetical protein